MSKIIKSQNYTSYCNDNDILHRIDGPAVEYSDGKKYWYLNGQQHRVDGPAVEWPGGYKAWYLNGQRHRADGPAVEYANGGKEWWYEGKFINCSTQQQFYKLIKLRLYW